MWIPGFLQGLFIHSGPFGRSARWQSKRTALRAPGGAPPLSSLVAEPCLGPRMDERWQRSEALQWWSGWSWKGFETMEGLGIGQMHDHEGPEVKSTRSLAVHLARWSCLRDCGTSVSWWDCRWGRWQEDLGSLAQSLPGEREAWSDGWSLGRSFLAGSLRRRE